MEFSLNGRTYWVNEFADGYAWRSEAREGIEGFRTAVEAQKDAIRYEQDRIDTLQREYQEARDRDRYGSYEQQMRRDYNDSRL